MPRLKTDDELVKLIDKDFKAELAVMLAENLEEETKAEDGWSRLDLHARALMLLLEKERERVEGDRGYFDVLMRRLREERARMEEMARNVHRGWQEVMAENARLADKNARMLDDLYLGLEKAKELAAENARLAAENARLAKELEESG